MNCAYYVCVFSYVTIATVYKDVCCLGGHLLVPFLFHDLTSLHPPSFHRNHFSTCHNYPSVECPALILIFGDQWHFNAGITEG